jgi:hypothetical protein
MAKCPVCGTRAAYFFERANDGTGVCGPPNNCKVEYNKILLSRGSSNSPGTNNSQVDNAEMEARKAEAQAAKAQANSEAEARRAEAQASKAQASAAKEQAKTQMLTALFASADAEDNQMREAIDYVSKMTFSSDSEELANQLNELVSTGASSNKFRNGKTLKKACYEKMEFGIMKLRQSGASDEADFFEKKRKSIKPGWF